VVARLACCKHQCSRRASPNGDGAGELLNHAFANLVAL
jgi:hypothetical protein